MMKKGVKIILVVIVLIGVALGGMILFGPKNYTVERTTVIKASPEAVFGQVSKFSTWKSWSPWYDIDPSQEISYEGTDGTVGSKYLWKSASDEVGTGSMTITSMKPSSTVNMDLEFTAPWESKSVVGFELSPKDGGTELTWTAKGDIEPMSRPFMIFMDMDEMIGSNYEKGFEKLKKILE